jgi:hypothetical protein
MGREGSCNIHIGGTQVHTCASRKGGRNAWLELASEVKLTVRIVWCGQTKLRLRLGKVLQVMDTVATTIPTGMSVVVNNLCVDNHLDGRRVMLLALMCCV